MTAKNAKKSAPDPPRIVLAVGISHPQIVEDWRKAYTVPKMDGSGETYLIDAEEYWYGTNCKILLEWQLFQWKKQPKNSTEKQC